MMEIKDEHKKFLKDLLNEFDKVKESSNSTETELKTTKVEVLKEMEDLSSKNSKDKLAEDVAIFKQMAYESNMDGYWQMTLPFIKLNDGYVELPDNLNTEDILEETQPLSKEELDEVRQLFDTSIVENKIIKLLNFKKHYIKICARYFNLRFQLKTFQSGNSNLLTESFFLKNGLTLKFNMK